MQILMEIIFDTACGWIGHTAVKLLTFGRIDLDWGKGSESVIAQWIGLFVLVGLIVLAASLRQHFA